MADFVRAIRRNWAFALALTLASAAIVLNVGAGVLALGVFVYGCAYIINMALRG